ncbi:MAG TPA: hypothetical protein VGG72_30285 [Bryobacteraceae bacterium]
MRAHAEEVAALHRRAIEAKDQTTHDHLAGVEVYAHRSWEDARANRA